MGYVCNLRSQNRGKSDPNWFNALARLRRNEASVEDIKLFNSRLRKKWDWKAIHLAYTNGDVNVEYSTKSLPNIKD